VVLSAAYEVAPAVGGGRRGVDLVDWLFDRWSGISNQHFGGINYPWSHYE
jgi:hypothetical protein